MSKADRQTMVMLSVAASCFWQLHKIDQREEVQDLCMLSYSTFADRISEWKIEDSALQKATPMIRQWSEEMEKDPGRLSAKCLMYMAGRILNDLSEKIKTPWKLEILTELSEFEGEVRKLIDDEGKDFHDYEYADHLLDQLYRIVDWRW